MLAALLVPWQGWGMASTGIQGLSPPGSLCGESTLTILAFTAHHGHLFIEHLLCARLYSPCFIQFNPLQNHPRAVLLPSPCYRRAEAQRGEVNLPMRHSQQVTNPDGLALQPSALSSVCLCPHAMKCVMWRGLAGSPMAPSCYSYLAIKLQAPQG